MKLVVVIRLASIQGECIRHNCEYSMKWKRGFWSKGVILPSNVTNGEITFTRDSRDLVSLTTTMNQTSTGISRKSISFTCYARAPRELNLLLGQGDYDLSMALVHCYSQSQFSVPICQSIPLKAGKKITCTLNFQLTISFVGIPMSIQPMDVPQSSLNVDLLPLYPAMMPYTICNQSTSVEKCENVYLPPSCDPTYSPTKFRKCPPKQITSSATILNPAIPTVVEFQDQCISPIKDLAVQLNACDLPETVAKEVQCYVDDPEMLSTAKAVDGSEVSCQTELSCNCFSSCQSCLCQERIHELNINLKETLDSYTMLEQKSNRLERELILKTSNIASLLDQLGKLKNEFNDFKRRKSCTYACLTSPSSLRSSTPPLDGCGRLSRPGLCQVSKTIPDQAQSNVNFLEEPIDTFLKLEETLPLYESDVENANHKATADGKAEKSFSTSSEGLVTAVPKLSSTSSPIKTTQTSSSPPAVPLLKKRSAYLGTPK